MEKEAKERLMAAVEGAKEISHFCVEMGFDFERLIEFAEDERSLKIIKKLIKNTHEISIHCVSIAVICKTVADGKLDPESVQKTIVKMILNGEIKIINEEEEEEET